MVRPSGLESGDAARGRRLYAAGVHRVQRAAVCLLREPHRSAESRARTRGPSRLARALRAAITRHEHAVRVLFTGSSETQLTKLFAATRASLYQFASRVAYSPLNAEFVAHVAHRFHAATRRELNAGECAVALGADLDKFSLVVCNIGHDRNNRH